MNEDSTPDTPGDKAVAIIDQSAVVEGEAVSVSDREDVRGPGKIITPFRVMVALVILVIEVSLVTPLIGKAYIWNQLYYSDSVNAQVQSQAQDALASRWENDDNLPPGAVVRGGIEHITSTPVTTPEGKEMAKITAPDLGDDWQFVVMEGVAQDTISRGPGHYPDTAGPGEVGNFALAGHRVGEGSPFDRLGELSTCSTINIETSAYMLTYTVLGKAGRVPSCIKGKVGEELSSNPMYATVGGRSIVTPSSYPVVWAIPEATDNDNIATIPLITITTCHPRFSDAQRMIVHGALTSITSKNNTQKEG